jgi:serine O-acetyltransferase
VLYSSGQELVVAEGTIVGANAVLRESTGPYEIWAGIPARRVGLRERDDTHHREGKGVVR